MNTIDTILNHRSIRKYKPDPVPENVLNDMLNAGIRASNTGNMQVYSMIVTRDEALRKQLCGFHFGQKMVEQAPVHITFCADINRFNKWCRMRKAEPGYDNLLWFVNAAIDALLASQNVCVAAEAHGLGICYLGTATYNADKIIELLDIPHGVIPVAAIVAGYPDDNPPLTDRLPMEAVVHYEKYQDYSNEAISALYAERESQEFTKNLLIENNVETLAQVFTERRYATKDNVFFSEKYLGLLKKQGFLNHGE
ncbi:MAG: nitroreductase family protein [Bacteroidetes bacterium]|nr:nitroreductase family protein [Bacteroidota bacterium]MBU1717884.1 nitroreductase family protein [Bacteroidota bacterium]